MRELHLVFTKILFYVREHVWDILIAALIIYEIFDQSIERRRERRDAAVAARTPPSVCNLGGEPGPLRISGRSVAGGGPVSGPQEIERTGGATITNLTSAPITITGRKLVIGDKQIPCRVLFRHARVDQWNPRTESATLGGSNWADYEIILRFSETSEPHDTVGKLYFSSSNRGVDEQDWFCVDINI